MADMRQVRVCHEATCLLFIPFFGAYLVGNFFARGARIGNDKSGDLTAEHSSDTPVTHIHLTLSFDRASTWLGGSGVG